MFVDNFLMTIRKLFKNHYSNSNCCRKPKIIVENNQLFYSHLESFLQYIFIYKNSLGTVDNFVVLRFKIFLIMFMKQHLKNKFAIKNKK